MFVANILLHLLWNCLEVLLAHLHRGELIGQKTHHLSHLNHWIIFKCVLKSLEKTSDSINGAGNNINT